MLSVSGRQKRGGYAVIKKSNLSRPGKFQKRPLSHKDYLYSAEDVKWSNELFEKQREQLQGLQLLHLAFAISNRRLPHFFLTKDLSVYTPPTKAALVVVDAT